MQFVEVSGPPGFAEAFAAILREHADALFVFPDPLTFGNRELIVGFANKNSIPALFGAREFVEFGGLMSYGSDYPALFRRAGNYVGRILNGESPADLQKNRRLRSLAMIQRVATCTATSTLALSRGLLGAPARSPCRSAPPSPHRCG